MGSHVALTGLTNPSQDRAEVKLLPCTPLHLFCSSFHLISMLKLTSTKDFYYGDTGSLPSRNIIFWISDIVTFIVNMNLKAGARPPINMNMYIYYTAL